MHVSKQCVPLYLIISQPDNRKHKGGHNNLRNCKKEPREPQKSKQGVSSGRQQKQVNQFIFEPRAPVARMIKPQDLAQTITSKPK